MEIRARYTLIGLFTLGVIAAIFAFVYWLNHAGGLTQRSLYRAQFENTVSGLLQGSAVLFNGIRVGEVSALQLDETNPRQVIATLAVAPTTPVRADTKVGIDFQGLMGAPVVSLRGGDAVAPALASTDGELPLLVADPNAGQTMTDAARTVLRNLDTVVTDNTEPLKTMIANINTFSAALARNSDRIDGIVAGVERMTGAGAKKAKAHVYDLIAPKTFPEIKKIPSAQIVLPEPDILGAVFNDEIIVNTADGKRDTTFEGKWPDTLSRVLQARMIQSFENANVLKILARQPDGDPADYQVLLDLRRFDATKGTAASANIAFSAKIIDSAGKIVAAKLFDVGVPIAATDEAGIAASLNQVFDKAVSEFVVWTCEAI